MAAAINALKMLHGYREAELVAARVSAAKMGFITSPDGDGYTGEDLEDTHAPIMNAEPGSFEQLPAGMTVQSFDPQHPVTAFSDFHKAVLRGISSSLGVSYAALASDLESVNYSSIRQGALDERDHYRTLQQLMIDHFVMPVFEAWLAAAMTSGSVNLPMTKYEKFQDSVIYRHAALAGLIRTKRSTHKSPACLTGFYRCKTSQITMARTLKTYLKAYSAKKHSPSNTA